MDARRVYLSSRRRTLPARERGAIVLLRGERGFIAEAEVSREEPTLLRDVKLIDDGASGKGFECAGTRLMCHLAPSNIDAARGTSSVACRPRA